MPRTRRIVPDNSVNHVLNRGNRRQVIFRKPADFDVFFNLLSEAQYHVPMRIIGVCLMPNHFHLVLWPQEGRSLSAYMKWLMNAHLRRYQMHYALTGTGHVYQGRFKNFIVQSDAHFYSAVRYVEGNPLRAKLVTSARDWQWSSLHRNQTPNRSSYLSEWPLPRPDNWEGYVNTGIPPDELAALRLSGRRGSPYGGQNWTQSTVVRHGLESTVRLPGRDRKKKVTATISAFE